MSRQNIAIKRIYEEPEPDDGVRMLVDRLWPRGIKKENASIDFWLKEVAPAINCASGSNMSQKNFQSFASTTRQSYTPERQAALEKLHQLAGQGPLTLVFAARDSEHNNAAVLRDVLISAHCQ
jgi:uncharacterized protein YeaO (DUF488 family)